MSPSGGTYVGATGTYGFSTYGAAGPTTALGPIMGTYGYGTYGGGKLGTYGSGGSLSAVGLRMRTYLPDLFYGNSQIMQALLEAEGVELEQILAAYGDIRDQFFVRRATWGLPYWESYVGITPTSDQTYQQRRDRIVSRLRGYGTATEDVVVSVARSYVQGQVQVVDDYDNYQVMIQFVDTVGVPSNILDLQSALRAVVPAHLGIVYQYRYSIWDHLDSQGLTWDALDALNLTWDSFDIRW